MMDRPPGNSCQSYSSHRETRNTNNVGYSNGYTIARYHREYIIIMCGTNDSTIRLMSLVCLESQGVTLKHTLQTYISLKKNAVMHIGTIYTSINYSKSYNVCLLINADFQTCGIFVLITLYTSISYKCSCRIIILLLYTVRCGCYFETSSCPESEVMLNGVFLHLFLLISLLVRYNNTYTHT